MIDIEKEGKYVIRRRHPYSNDVSWYCRKLMVANVNPPFTNDFKFATIFNSIDEAHAIAKQYHGSDYESPRAEVYSLEWAKSTITEDALAKSGNHLITSLDKLHAYRHELIKHTLQGVIAAYGGNPMIGDLPGLAIRLADETIKQIVDNPYWYNQLFDNDANPLAEDQYKVDSNGHLIEITSTNG